jgi:hypothetical protein
LEVKKFKFPHKNSIFRAANALAALNSIWKLRKIERVFAKRENNGCEIGKLSCFIIRATQF